MCSEKRIGMTGINNIVILIPGFNNWERDTVPLLESIRLYEPKLPVILIDNASEPPYPKWDGITQVRLEREPDYSVAKANNVAMRLAGDCDWYLLLNNDMKLTRSFSRELEGLDPHYFYNGEIRKANKTNRPHNYGIGRPFIISRDLYQTIGEFDEKFLVYSCEDVDYSYRAMKAGFPLKQLDTGIWHADYRDQERKRQYLELAEQVKANEKYLAEKHGFDNGK